MESRSQGTMDRREQGFTLIEMVVAVALAAVVFTALAMYLGSSLKVLAIQKARTQGNEIATQAIEDLQRLDDELIGLCTAPASPPAGFSDAVLLPNCKVPMLTDPCSPPPTAITFGDRVAKHQYTCTRLNIVYTVKRYVAWTTADHVEKQFASYVTWRDSGRNHEVFQRSARPARTAPTVTASVSPSSLPGNVNGSGILASNVAVNATTTGLTAGDSVRVSFTYRDPGDFPKPAVLPLTTTDGGATWTRTISSADFKFPEGNQFFLVSVKRASDKKEAWAPAVSYRFCSATPICSAPAATVTVNNVWVGATAASTGASPFDIDAAGSLVSAGIVVKATTANVSPPGYVTLLLPTLSGPRTVPMTNTCGANCWEAVITKAVAAARGYRFSSAAPQPFKILAGQGTNNGHTVVSPAPDFTASFR